MTTIVAVFDDANDLERSVERLAGADFENTVYDETIVTQEIGEVSAARPVLAPGSTPEVVLGSESPNLLPRPDQQAIRQAFRERLSKHGNLSNAELDAYTTAFLHDGKFVVVEAEDERAEQAMQILKDSGATRVTRHE